MIGFIRLYPVLKNSTVLYFWSPNISSSKCSFVEDIFMMKIIWSFSKVIVKSSSKVIIWSSSKMILQQTNQFIIQQSNHLIIQQRKLKTSTMPSWLLTRTTVERWKQKVGTAFYFALFIHAWFIQLIVDRQENFMFVSHQVFTILLSELAVVLQVLGLPGGVQEVSFPLSFTS